MKTKTSSTKKQKNLIDIVEFITFQAEDSALCPQFLRNVKEPANHLAGFLGCTRIQAVLFAVICSLNFINKTVGLEQVAALLGMPPQMLARYLNDLERLQKARILISESEISKLSNLSFITATTFSVNPEVFNALRKGVPVQKARRRIRDNYEFIKSVAGVIELRNKEIIPEREMWKRISGIEQECSSIRLCKELKSLVYGKQERALFLNLCNAYFAGITGCELLEQIGQIVTEEQEQPTIRFRISKGRSQLVTNDLIEIRESFFRGESEIRLTDHAIKMMTSDNPGISECLQEKKDPDLMTADSIVRKELHFAPKEKEQLESLVRILMPGEFDKIVTRLSSSGMKTGVAVLLDGPPGTGKTESVLQIARRTGRDIFQVTISETKSKWFGESERLIKGIFDRYRKMASESDITPILFFNEADGIFSSRTRIGDSGISQVENAIQNIILQEMEDFSGILIATTNMVQNFDKAFERRFLYKINLGKPTAEVRSLIWKERIPSLSAMKALELARKFDLTGGQINNVARKYSIERISNRRKPPHDQVESWCREENSNNEIKAIGYKL